MTKEKRNIVQYIVAIVSEFAMQHKLTESRAYRYINFHKGISFIEANYNAIHTLDFSEAVDCVALYCRNSGGKL